MAPTMRAAGACAVLSALAAAYQMPQNQPGWDKDAVPKEARRAGCPSCRMEGEYVWENDWAQPGNDDLSKVHEAGREGGMSSQDADRMLGAIREVAGMKGAFLVTVTDGGMLRMAKNMIGSLDAVPCKAPRLIIGMGKNICKTFEGLSRTTCVEVFQDAAGSEDEVDWGSHEYWQVVFRKHVVLTMVAMSKVARYAVYTDPDIVFLECPVSYLVKTYRDTHDIVFSPNNMLEPTATSVEDVAETYESRGMKNIQLGPHNRHADINTGLFLMSSSTLVGDLMLKTMRIFKEQEFVHGHYQQFSLVKALDEVPGLRIGVARGDRLVNGNVFWGHRQLLKPEDVISVHANWMQANLKVPCLKSAGLWIDVEQEDAKRGITSKHWGEGPVARMDSRFATVESCGDDAVNGHARPSPPTARGCYLWLPTGCKAHKFNAQDNWRWMEDMKDRNQCEVESKKMYDTWCGTDDAVTLLVEGLANAPAEPGKPGCYVWMPSGCESKNFHAQTSWRPTPALDYTTKDACTQSAPEKFNRWCDAKDTQALWVPAPPAVPAAEGCYAWLPTGCRQHPAIAADDWVRDTIGEEKAGAKTDQAACDARKAQIDAWCGVSNAQMSFVKGA